MRSHCLPRCETMGKLDKSVLVYIDAEIRSWLEEKVNNGYKMGGLIRHLLRKQMEYEKNKRQRQPEPGHVAQIGAKQ